MGDKIKISVLEVNGQELDYDTEVSLTASVVELDPPLNGIDDVQAFLSSFTKRIDGGFSASIYLADQCFDGGSASG